MPHSRDAAKLADTLMAVTLSASAAIDMGDWETAGQLLRRREQVLTQLENSENLAAAGSRLRRVQSAEQELVAKLERATQEAVTGLGATWDLHSARKAYFPKSKGARFFENTG